MVWKSVLGIVRDSQWKGWSVIGEVIIFAKVAGCVAAGAGTAGRFVTGIGLKADFTAWEWKCPESWVGFREPRSRARIVHKYNPTWQPT